MMGQLDHDQGEFFYSFRLDEAIPDDHPARAIAAVLDLSWVRSELAPFYPTHHVEPRPLFVAQRSVEVLEIGTNCLDGVGNGA